MARLVEDVDARRRHGLIDPAQTIDGDLFDQQLFDLGAHVGRHFVDQGFWRHDASSTSILPRPRRAGATHMRDSDRERIQATRSDPAGDISSRGRHGARRR